MNDTAYDITHLLEAECQQALAPEPRALRSVPAVAAKPVQPRMAEAQEALARELMQSAAVHEALIQQYLRMSGETFREAYGQ